MSNDFSTGRICGDCGIVIEAGKRFCPLCSINPENINNSNQEILGKFTQSLNVKIGEYNGAKTIEQEFQEAYQRGRADREKELLEGGIDGFCVFHKDGTILEEEFGKVEIQTQACQAHMTNWTDNSGYEANNMINKGWQIVPVKIIKQEKV